MYGVSFLRMSASSIDSLCGTSKISEEHMLHIYEGSLNKRDKTKDFLITIEFLFFIFNFIYFLFIFLPLLEGTDLCNFFAAEGSGTMLSIGQGDFLIYSFPKGHKIKGHCVASLVFHTVM